MHMCANHHECCRCMIHSSPPHTLWEIRDSRHVEEVSTSSGPECFPSRRALQRLNRIEEHWTKKVFTVTDSLDIVPGVCSTSGSVSWNRHRLPYWVIRRSLLFLLGSRTHDADVAWNATHPEAFKTCRKPSWCELAAIRLAGHISYRKEAILREKFILSDSLVH